MTQQEASRPSCSTCIHMSSCALYTSTMARVLAYFMRGMVSENTMEQTEFVLAAHCRRYEQCQ